MTAAVTSATEDSTKRAFERATTEFWSALEGFFGQQKTKVEPSSAGNDSVMALVRTSYGPRGRGGASERASDSPAFAPIGASGRAEASEQGAPQWQAPMTPA